MVECQIWQERLDKTNKSEYRSVDSSELGSALGRYAGDWASSFKAATQSFVDAQSLASHGTLRQSWPFHKSRAELARAGT